MGLGLKAIDTATAHAASEQKSTELLRTKLDQLPLDFISFPSDEQIQRLIQVRLGVKQDMNSGSVMIKGGSQFGNKLLLKSNDLSRS
jgi:hypothetical protein